MLEDWKGQLKRHVQAFESTWFANLIITLLGFWIYWESVHRGSSGRLGLVFIAMGLFRLAGDLMQPRRQNITLVITRLFLALSALYIVCRPAIAHVLNNAPWSLPEVMLGGLVVSAVLGAAMKYPQERRAP